jgi:hypothetical protein
MPRSISAENLLREAREATGTPNVREAVRNLTLHALRSRPLSAAHIATVAHTVCQGIESSDLPPTLPVRETRLGAWAGLEDAVGQALQAVELAAREFAEGRAGLAGPERNRLLEEVAQLERSLDEGWGCHRSVPTGLKSRIASAASHLRQAPPHLAGPARASGADAACEAFSFVASGILVGLSEPVRSRAAGLAH